MPTKTIIKLLQGSAEIVTIVDGEQTNREVVTYKDGKLYHGDTEIVVSGSGGSETLQEVIDNGSVLDKDNTIEGSGFQLKIYGQQNFDVVSGDETFTNKAGNIQANENGVNFYSQDNGDINDVTVNITPTEFKIAKRVSSVSSSYKEIVTSVNNVLADITGNVNVAALALIDYQNSAMSASMKVYKRVDKNGNIFEIYEPTQNNRVSRSQFAYDDTIDLFPFDSADCFNANLTDVKIIPNENDILKINSSILKFMVVNANGGTINLIRHNQIGNYGVGCPNGAEIYNKPGITSTFDHNTCEAISDDYPGYFDNIGDGAVFKSCRDLKGINVHDPMIGFGGQQTMLECNMGAGGDIYFNEFAASLWYANTGNEAILHFISDQSLANDIGMDASAEIVVSGTAYANIKMGVSSVIGDPESDPKLSFAQCTKVEIGIGSLLTPSVDATETMNRVSIGLNTEVTTDGDLVDMTIGNSITYEPTGAQSNKNIQNIAGAAYELGVTDNAVTATAV